MCTQPAHPHQQLPSVAAIAPFTAVVMVAAVILLPLAAWISPALAGGPPAPKAPEVSTVGAGPYTGPLPEELAKLARVAAAVQTLPSPAKEPARATITAGGGSDLTVEEQAKLAAFRAIHVTLPVAFLKKLSPRPAPKDGIPALTAEELEKHARQGAASTVRLSKTGSQR